MADLTMDEVERRLKDCEENIKELYGKNNQNERDLVATTTTLNNVMEKLGELKASVEAIKNRPATLWDKLIAALIGAAASGIIAYLIGR